MRILPLGEAHAILYDPRLKISRIDGRGSNKQHEVILGIGGNQGRVRDNFCRLLRAFQKSKRVDIISFSPLYENPPFGHLDQPNFYNAILRIGWAKGYRELFAYTSYLERRFGRPRRRAFKNAPRSLDIDLIFFGDKKIHAAGLMIPHEHWAKRDSVLVPLILDLKSTRV